MTVAGAPEGASPLSGVLRAPEFRVPLKWLPSWGFRIDDEQYQLFNQEAGWAMAIWPVPDPMMLYEGTDRHYGRHANLWFVNNSRKYPIGWRDYSVSAPAILPIPVYYSWEPELISETDQSFSSWRYWPSLPVAWMMPGEMSGGEEGCEVFKLWDLYPITESESAELDQAVNRTWYQSGWEDLCLLTQLHLGYVEFCDLSNSDDEAEREKEGQQIVEELESRFLDENGYLAADTLNFELELPAALNSTWRTLAISSNYNWSVANKSNPRGRHQPLPHLQECPWF